MSGIYIHIPFCKQACSYCNFHFSTHLNTKESLLLSLHDELKLRADYLDEAAVESIYFGGGTPSLLTTNEINQLIETISSLFRVSPDAEITLEANPDDLSPDKINALKDSPLNRLSIGVQSFYDDELQYMNRAHTAKESLTVLENVLKAGFKSFTMDLIYGTPLLTEKRWIESMERVASMDVPHLSAYQLTIEPKTALAHQIRAHKAPAPDEEATVRQFELLMDWAEDHGYAHYEISNLAKAGHRAAHNSNYWQGVPYLGIGPSAHSFNGTERAWNIANNALYIKSIEAGSAFEGSEILSPDDLYNEYIMTGLRRIEGINVDKLRKMGSEYQDYFISAVQPYLETGDILFADDHWSLSRKGRFFADRIASELFRV